MSKVAYTNQTGVMSSVTNSRAALEYVGDFCHGCSPDVFLILGWNGHSYQIENRRYPKVALQKASEYQSRLIQAIHSGGAMNEKMAGNAVSYYANLWTIGRGFEAHHWILQRLTGEARHRYLQALPDTRHRLRHLNDLIQTDQRRFWTDLE